LPKWVRRLTNWNGRQAPLAVWTEKIAPLVEATTGPSKNTRRPFRDAGHSIVAHVSIADLTMRVPVDSHGVALWKPVERDVLQADCARCELVPVCRQLPR